MKKIMSLIAALIIMVCATANAFAAKSPTVESLIYFSASITYEILENPSLEDIAFADWIFKTLIDENYVVYEAFTIELKTKVEKVELTAPTINDGPGILLLIGTGTVYFLPAEACEKENTVVLDFTDVKTGIYTAYYIGAPIEE